MARRAAAPVQGEIAVTYANRRDTRDIYNWLYERAEDAASDGLPLDQALQAVRDGYSSIEADRTFAADESGE